jgi:DNA helicase HerA-like ATPase/DNA-binding MarR family transcriptional regulator
MPSFEQRDIKEEVKRLIPFLGAEKARRLEAAYYFGDEDYRKKIFEIIDGIKAMTIADEDLDQSVLIEPPSKEIAMSGSIEMGKVLYGKKEFYPLRLEKKDFLTHLAIFGSSGSGKTNIIHNIVKSFTQKEIPILIFDFSKRNYRDLMNVPELKDKVNVFTVGRNAVPFRFNPLVPPEGVQISQWAKEFAEVFDHAYWLMGGGRHIVLQALDELYTYKAPDYPKIQDMRKWVEQKTSSMNSSTREKNWIATATRPLQSLCFRETGEVFDCERGINPAQFFEKGITILEIDALSNDDKTFFIEIILQWIRDWLLVSNKREELNGIIILEEAHHVLNREKTRKLGIEAVTDLIFREIRELGIGMVYVDQHPSMISYPALGNTSSHIYMNLGLDTKYSSDIQDAASMLGLKEDDKDYLRRLPTGHAFVLIRRSAFPNPFLVKFPLAIAERGQVTDEMLREMMEKKVLSCIEEKKISLARVPKEKRKPRTIEERQLDEKMRKVTSNGWKILDILWNSEAAYMSALAKEMKMSNRVFKQEIEKLVKQGFIASRQAKVYKQKAVYYFLTHEAELALALKTGRLQEGRVVGDFEEKILDKLWKMKYDVVEKLEGKVVVTRDKKEMVINFALTSNSGKLFELLKENMDNEIYFACGSQKIKNSLLQQAAKYSFTHPSDSFSVLVTDLDDFEKGGKFEKAEFGS